MQACETHWHRKNQHGNIVDMMEILQANRKKKTNTGYSQKKFMSTETWKMGLTLDQENLNSKHITLHY